MFILLTTLVGMPATSSALSTHSNVVAVNKRSRAYANTAARSIARDYNQVVEGRDRDNLSYIVTTLGKQPLYKIALQESALNRAGEEINHIHPLRFLECVFTDEEMKVCIRKIPGRDWVGKKFLDGLVGSLGEEYLRGNLLPFINDFASNVKIDPNAIIPLVQSQKWQAFINRLMEIPRQAGSDRYNM